MATIDLKKDPSTSDAAKEVNNATHLEARVVSAPAHIDRGWAWVILAVAFFARVLNGGFVWSLNFYFVAFHEAFRESRTYTSLVGALAFATYHSAAPLASFAVQRLGVRTSFILGSLMITANYLANAHANGILYLIITNTALFGLGYCICAYASMVALNQYFRRYMYLATGLSLAGSGLGTFLFAPLMPFLQSIYGWRGSMYLMAGIGLQLLIGGALLFPNKSITPSERSATRKKEEDYCDVAGPVLKSRLFWLLNFSQFFVCFGQFSILVLLRNFAIVREMESSYSWVQAALGIGDITGRVFSGYLANRQFMNNVLLYSLLDVYCALVVLSLIVVQDTISFVSCAMLFGVGFGGQVSLLCIIPVDIFGKQNYAVVLGYTPTMAGVGALLGPPLSSLITDATGSYTWTLVLIGASQLTAAVLLFLIYLVQRNQKK